MAPFCKAVNVQPGALGANISIYSGNIDPEWSVAAVPNGGYVLALLVEACVQYQSTTAHKNPLHVTAHFLQASSVIPFEIHVRVIKSGKSFTNLMAELAQKGTTRVTTHMIFGTNAPLSAQQMRVSINPPSSYARQIPLHLHPSKSTAAPLRNAFKFNHHIKTTTDPVIHARNAVDSPTRTTSSTIGGGGLEWGGWLEFVDMDDRITNPSLAFLVDIFMNLVSILPKEVGGDLDKCWVPTLVLSLEFKNPIRHDIDAHRTRSGQHLRILGKGWIVGSGEVKPEQGAGKARCQISGFLLPSIHSAPPFFTEQPNLATQAAATDHWIQLILSYASHRKLFFLKIEDAETGGNDWDEVLRNDRINRKILPLHLLHLMEAMIKKNVASYEPPKQTRSVMLYWKAPEEWAEVLHNWATSTGQLNTILTYYDITDPPVESELTNIPTPLLKKAITILIKAGKAQVIGISEGEGVRFFAG
ncbi:hypothetical protein APHAL10511_002257 [Amanita phalloides]|nr:hypothetical protein APHAL10511_002257 [Amanita phalloides]